MMHDVCVVIPIYKERLTENERISVEQTINVLGCTDIFFVTYKKLDRKYYDRYTSVNYIFFNKKYFQSVSTYNELLVNTKFYSKFKKYKYMLIVQTDAMILGDYDDLLGFMEAGFDYWGAPWQFVYSMRRYQYIKNNRWMLNQAWLLDRLASELRYLEVGNGGLSLRNIRNTIRILNKNRFFAKRWLHNEDQLFSYFGASEDARYKTAPRNLAAKFSLEGTIDDDWNPDDKPFGVHAWAKYFPQLLKELN